MLAISPPFNVFSKPRKSNQHNRILRLLHAILGVTVDCHTSRGAQNTRVKKHACIMKRGNLKGEQWDVLQSSKTLIFYDTDAGQILLG